MAPTVDQTTKPAETARRSAQTSSPLVGQQTEVRQALAGLPLVAPGDYKVAPSPDGGVIVYFNPLDVQKWPVPLAEAFARYISQVFPGSTRAEAEACAQANGVRWVHEIPNNIEHLPSVPVTFLGPLHANVKKWFKDHRPDIQPVEPTGRTFSLSGAEGSREAISTFDPEGSLVIEPEETAYVLGGTMRVQVLFTGEAVRRAFNYSSASAFFDWSVTDAAGKQVLSGPLLEGWGARKVEIDLDASKLLPGQRYSLRVAVTSRYFRQSPFRPEPVPFLTATEEQRDLEVFEALLRGQDSPFERVNGQLQLKKGARAATLEDELDQASYWTGWVAGLEKRGAITAAQAEEYREVFAKRKAHLKEKRELVSGSLPYFAFGTLIDATSSAHTRLNFAVYGQQESAGETFRHQLRVVDSTLSPNDPPVYTGTGEGANPDLAERAALADLLADWRSHNSYPDGTVHLGIRLWDGSIREETMDTRHLKKVVKRNAGRAALVAGGVGLGLSLYTGGTTAPPALVALETGATLVAVGGTLLDVGLRLEERLSTHTQRADSQALLDVLAVASLGLGTWAQVARAAKPAGGGKFILPIFGLDASQTVVMGAQVHDQIEEIDLRYEQQMETASEDQKKDLARERDAEIKGLVTESILTGGIAVVPVVKGAGAVVDLGIAAHAARPPRVGPTPHVPATRPPVEAAPAVAHPAPEIPAPPKIETPQVEAAPTPIEAEPLVARPVPELPAPKIEAPPPAAHELRKVQEPPPVQETPKVQELPKAQEAPKVEEPARAPEPLAAVAEPVPAPVPESVKTEEPAAAPGKARKKKSAKAAEKKKGTDTFQPLSKEAQQKQVDSLRSEKAQKEQQLREKVADQIRSLRHTSALNALKDKGQVSEVRQYIAENRPDLKRLGVDDETSKAVDVLADLSAERVKLGNEEKALRNDLAVLDRVIDIVAHPEKHRLSLPCFARGTLVWTPAGLRPIEEIRVGDLVQAWDHESATLVQRRVLQVFHNRTLHFYEISWGDAKVEATGRHRFWVEDRGEWIAAKELAPGMQCRLPDGRTLEVTAVRRRDAADEETFNFQVDEVANYFVGPGVLAHNQGDEPIPSHLGGDFFVYLGFNAQERFAKFVYVGQTEQTVPKREGQHQDFAKKQLLRTDLTPEQREFYEFMSEVELIPVVEGLTAPAADWVEQHNINLETEVRGEFFVMNRREQITSKEHRGETIRKLLEDPVVRKRYCPE